MAPISLPCALAQVSDWLAGGTLKDMVHNVSMQLDLEMILSVLMDVAVAMAYFYRLELPVAHKQLSSEQVDPVLNRHTLSRP